MVLEVATKKTSLKHNSYLILVEYNLGGGINKRKEMIISSVLKVAPPPQELAKNVPKPQIPILDPLEMKYWKDHPWMTQ